MKASGAYLKTLTRWLVCMLAMTALFLAVTYLGWYQKTQRIQTMMQLTLIVGCALLYAARNRLTKPGLLCAAILFAGIVMRVGYALYTPTTIRFHDLAPIDISATGHAGYVLNLYENGALPPDNAFQYAQPPLYYALAAFSMQLYHLLTGLTNTVELFEAARLPSLLASCGALLVSYRIGQELGFKEKAMAWFLSICAFLPNHYLLAGRANPDGLAVFFIFWIVLYALRWHRAQTTRHTLCLALGFGLGMMTKLTVAVLAIPVGVMMVVVLWQKCVRARHWQPLWQFALFLAVAAPLALWHPIRNAILYAQPFGYVFEMSPDDPLYIGNLSLLHRLGLFNPRDLFSPLYIDWSTGTNVLLYTFKSSVFGEFSYDMDVFVPYALLLSNVALVTLSTLALVRVAWVSLRARTAPWLLLVGMHASMLLAYLALNLRYPFCCSMDYRYMVGTSLIGALALARAQELTTPEGKLSKAYTLLTQGALILFAASSVVMYTSIA